MLVGSLAAGVATLAADWIAVSALAGLAAAAALYGPVFLRETSAALGADATQGSFDPGGWVLTLVSLITGGILVGWAGATLGGAIRPSLVAAWAVVRQGGRGPRGRLEIRRPIAVVLVVCLLAVTMPALGAMLNFAPDSLMRHGGAPLPALVQGNNDTPPGLSLLPTAPGDAPGPSPTPSLSPSPSPSPDATPVARPWLAWRPTGAGTVLVDNLPAPWVGGVSTTDDVSVYLPPGYDRSPGRRYPVLYEAPTPYYFWDGATDAKTVLDALIDSGAIPASIVVFIDSGSSPYPDTECVDSFDGREWLDRYVAETVVPWVDRHFRTIAQPAARAIFGMSQGGYCAAILALHHADVFGAEISFSGYYQAGIGSVNSLLPFGGDAALLAADSPMVVAGRLPVAQRAGLYFVLVADPSQSFYGPQAATFARTLATDGYPQLTLAAAVPHGWTQVRQEFPAALEAVATRQAAVGVFG